MSTVKADNFTWKSGQSGGLTGTNVTGDQIVYGVAKGWVNFSGSSGITTRGTFNSSSITRSQAGNYHFSFSVSLSDSNYSTLGTASIAGTTFALFTGDEIANRTTSRTGLCWTTNAASVNSAVDSNNVSINVFR